MGPRIGLDGRKILPPTGIRSSDRPACSQSLYRLSYPAHISLNEAPVKFQYFPIPFRFFGSLYSTALFASLVPVPTSLYMEATDPPKRRCNYDYKITCDYVQENRPLQVKFLLHNTVDRFSDQM